MYKNWTLWKYVHNYNIKSLLTLFSFTKPLRVPQKCLGTTTDKTLNYIKEIKHLHKG